MPISAAFPFNLQNGLSADATQVMANFLQLQNDVNANAANNGANSNITSLTGLTTPLSIPQGGTGASDAVTALTNLGAAPLVSPGFSGIPTAPTPGNATNTTQVATTAFVQALLAAIIAGYAPLNSPALTGTPTAPTAAAGTNTTQLATTAFVQAIFSSLLNVNYGWVKVGTWILQWAESTNIAPGGTGSVTWPLTFPNACLSAVAGNIGIAGNATAGGLAVGRTLNTTGTSMFNWGGLTTAARVFAIGY